MVDGCWWIVTVPSTIYYPPATIHNKEEMIMKKTIIKIVLTLMTIYFAVIPISVDIGEGHLLNPEWAPHSKLHLVWFLLFTALIAGVSIYTLWGKDEIFVPALIGLSFNIGFLVAR